MNLEQLKSNWQKQLSSENKKAISTKNQKTDDMLTITNQMLAIDKKVKERTVYGIIGFSIIICALSALNYLMFLLDQSFFTIAGTATWIFWLIISILHTKKFQNKRNENTLCIKKSLELKLNKVNKEIKYYQTLVYWILAPMIPGLILILIGSQASAITFISFSIIWILGMYCANQYNLRYIEQNLKPIKQEVTATLASLT